MAGSDRSRASPIVLLAITLAGCRAGDTGSGNAEEVPGAMPAAPVRGQPAEPYSARLAPVNDHLTGASPSGTARLGIHGDSLTIEVDAEGVPPGMMYLQHFHGFEDGRPARCPTPAADANGDGVVDLIETEAVAGVTMVPFHADPASMEIEAETYPETDARGRYSYRRTVDLDALRAAFERKFGTRDLALDRRVVFIHGVPPDTELPASVRSLEDVPAHVTLPIVCGELDPAG